MSDKIKHSEPINIPNSHHSHSRTRSASFSTSSDDDSNSPPLQTPPSSSLPPPRIGAAYSPSSSPILSYFFHTPVKVAPAVSPSAATGFNSFGRGFTAKPHEQPIIEEDEDHEAQLSRHMRRMSTSAGWAPAAPRFNPAPATEQTERGTGLLRRLSLGGAFIRPQPPSPPTQHAVPASFAPAAPVPVPEAKATASHGRKKRRASMFGVPGEGGRSRRPPSPMGERMLTGHFDGFN